MTRTYEVSARPAHLGGGWNLALFDDGERAGGGVFPLAAMTDQESVEWWNGADENERGHWLYEAGSAAPADAWQAYLLAEAHADAVGEGENWVGPVD